tara:strand:+ start:199 stop:1296 length:1098 start_codon:yes stop_codon:yes gene_type:complete
MQMFNGAFFGFLLSIIIPSPRNKSERYLRLIENTEWVLQRFNTKVMLFLFVIGCAFLLQRVASVGLNMDYLSEVRAVYRQRQGGALLRIGSHLSVLMTMMVIMRGLVDSYRGVDIKALGLVILVAAPLGLANGGRTFLLSFMLAYLSSLLLARSSIVRRRRFRMPIFFFTSREIITLGGLLAFLLLTFALMGFARGGYGHKLDIIYTLLIWPVSTLVAMDDWVFAALSSERTNGLNTFGWFVSILSRIGLIDVTQSSEVMKGVAYYFESTYNSAIVVPRSILPDLIFDFGPSGIFVSIAIIAFTLEFITTRLPARGYFMHVLAVQGLLASFMTIQNNIMTPGAVVTVFWGAVLALVMRNKWGQRR